MSAPHTALPSDLDFDPDALRESYRAERDKRLRPDGNASTVEITGEFAPLRRRPLRRARLHPRAADRRGRRRGHRRRVRRPAGRRPAARGRASTDFRIIEKGGDFGGTWYWNRYPGAQCDIESYFYLPLLEELGYMPEGEVLVRRRRSSSTPSAIGRALRPLRQRAASRRRSPSCDWDEASPRWIVTHRPRRRASRARFVVMAHRPAQPAQAARHPRHRELRGPHVPHQPLGLRLHRRRHRTAA